MEIMELQYEEIVILEVYSLENSFICSLIDDLMVIEKSYSSIFHL